VEQLALFDIPLPYKYIIDASSMLSQKDGEPNTRAVHKSLWKYIDSLIKNETIVTCSEVAEEIQDSDILQWLKDTGCKILPVDDTVQANVANVVTNQPDLIDFKQVKSSGDAFLIATAMKFGLIIITEEKKNSPKKIPQVASTFNITTVNINEFCALEEMEF